jgi:ethanolamine ammonia-lyase large subunit
MLGYQSTSFHDALAIRDLLGKRPAPEFEAWLNTVGLLDHQGRIRPPNNPEKLATLLLPLPLEEGRGENPRQARA